MNVLCKTEIKIAKCKFNPNSNPDPKETAKRNPKA